MMMMMTLMKEREGKITYKQTKQTEIPTKNIHAY